MLILLVLNQYNQVNVLLQNIELNFTKAYIFNQMI